jgi:Predicted acetyltransferase
MITTKTGLEIVIRCETPADYAEVNALIYESFATNADDLGDTADYFIAVRKKDTFIPALSFLAALTDGKIVGQVALYKTDIITETRRITQLVLSPISVSPAFFKRGIAREMIAFSLSKAKEMGYTAVLLQGNPRFYEKFGFEATYKHGIFHESDADRDAEHCMVNILTPGALDGISGMTYYD